MTETKRKTWIVDESGAGDYRTLTEAVAACAATPDEPVRFYIRHGIYEERPFIELADYVIEGEYRNATVITASVGGRDPWPGEVKTGTFRSATLFLGGGRAVVRNLTVQNNAGDGAKAGQALAVYADASRVLMENVNLYGNQDTLFTAPLPLQEREQNGFRGPRENTPRLDTVQYYKNCTIRGNIDFIFGGANAVFDTCRLEPWHHISGTCYITAPSTPAGKPGYLFVNCTVQGSCAPFRCTGKSATDEPSITNDIQRLSAIFDVVRLVDPTKYAVLDLDADGILHRTGERCAAFWDNEAGCANCISARAFAEHTTLNKLEFTRNEMYFVIAKYITINGTPCVLELVSRLNEGRWIDANGSRFLLDRTRGEDMQLFLDPLTNVYSRRYFETYRTHLEGMEGVALIDVNNFKLINDRCGHAAGDAALRDIANAVRSCIRKTDILIRYGGDEFLLLFPRMTEEVFLDKKKQIQQAVRGIRMSEFADIQLSVSIGGICGVHPITEAIRKADYLMYLDKAEQKS